jgi:hypothetical protein
VAQRYLDWSHLEALADLLERHDWPSMFLGLFVRIHGSKSFSAKALMNGLIVKKRAYFP